MTPAKNMFALTDIREWYDDHIKTYLLKKLEEFQERDSGWALDMVINLRVHNNKYTVSTYYDLPAINKSKKAVINVYNNDQHGFLWSIMSALIASQSSPNGIKHLVAKPNFHSMVVMDNDISIVEMQKTQIFFNKPIYVGFCILDVSKTFVYDFHYNYMYQRYGKDSEKLLYTDTDILIYDIKGSDVYEVMKQDIHRFDTTEYAPNNVYAIWYA